MPEFKERASEYVYSSANIRDASSNRKYYPITVITKDNQCFYEIPCGLAKMKVGEVLNCRHCIVGDTVFTERSDLRDALYEYIQRDFDGDDRELEQAVERKEEEYYQYWEPCIMLCIPVNDL